MRATELPQVLRGAGLDVDVMAGFANRGRDLDAINGLLWHHTASSPAWEIPALLALLRDGRSDLSGPLYQAGVDRTGRWHCIAAGRANHAGAGQWPGLDGNDDTLGLVAFHRGTSSERWDTGQLASWRVGTAAVCGHYGIDPGRFLIGHKEWTDRKVDPYALHMPNERRTVAAIMEDDMFTDDDRALLKAISGPVSDGRSQLLDKVIKSNIELGRQARQRAEISEALDKIDRLAAATGPDAEAIAAEIRRHLAEALSD